MIDRIPVHHRLLAKRDPRFQHLQKEPLLMLIIPRLAGHHLAAPVVAEADRFQLLAHRRDILFGPHTGMHPALDRRILRRQSERIPPHRVEHVIAPRPAKPRRHIAQRVIAHMPHMDVAGGIREHLQHEIIRLLIGRRGREYVLRIPGSLPFRLGFTGVVTGGIIRR